MSIATPRRLRLLACLGLATATALVLVAPAAPSGATVPGSTTDGVLCEPNSVSNGQVVFNLDATDGYMAEPDGNSIYMWSYTASGRSFQLPGPTLCVPTGTKVTVVLHNQLPEDTSIVFSGQQGVQADGKPVQPQFDAAGVLTSLVDVAAHNGGSITYTFTAGRPGTYLYGTGTDVAKQRDMGLYGALIVRPTSAVNQDTDSALTAFKPGQEYLYLLSQVDPALHLAVEQNKAYDYTKSVGRYFLINGRSMPDTLAPNNAAWLPNQPYGALIRIQPYDAKHNPLPALVRYLNAGPVNYPFHPHGSSQRVVVRDGVPVTDAGNQDASYLKYLVDVGPGQSVDALLMWSNEYDPSSTSIDPNAPDPLAAGNGHCSNVPAAPQPAANASQSGGFQCAALPGDIKLPQLQDQIVGPGTETWFSENPYLGAPGGQGQIPTGVIQNNECGEFYQIAHSHALEESTNYGASFGGMMTVIRIDPSGGCK